MPKEIISVPNSSARVSSSQVWVSFSGERILSINKHYLFVNKDKSLFAKIAPEEGAGRSFAEKTGAIQPNVLLCQKEKIARLMRFSAIHCANRANYHAVMH
ncbi:hypothetical protein BN1200_410033 [Klebsiella variicola]|nr:hypothetical protein BN1200_410033 [Klebsiella variicola]